MSVDNQDNIKNSLKGLFQYWNSVQKSTADGLAELEYMGPAIEIDGHMAPVGNWETHLDAGSMCEALQHGYNHNPRDLANHIYGRFNYQASDILEGVRSCCPDLTEEEAQQIDRDLGGSTPTPTAESKKIALKNRDGSYFGFKADNHEPIWGSSDRIGGYEELHLVHNSNGTYSFKNRDGNYFGYKAGNDPEMWVTATRIGRSEEWEMVNNANGTVAFKCSGGTYLGFKADNHEPIWASSDRIGGYEELTIEDL